MKPSLTLLRVLVAGGSRILSLAFLPAAGLSPPLIERVAALLTVDPDWPSAVPGPATVPYRR
jgi:hypothetical protein